MTIARVYRMTAAAGKEQALADALVAFIPVVSAVPGCSGAEALRDCDAASRFLFIEKWTSIDAHKAAGSHLPKDALAGVMGALGAPPEGSYEEYLA